MMRIEEKFKQLQKQNKKAFIAYIPFGYPSCEATADIIFVLQDAGVDIIELGLPFSDPLADGSIIQAASTQALSNGATVQRLFGTIEKIKNRIHVPLVFMTYYNVVFHFGENSFFRKMHENDVSGIMAVDLPLEESRVYLEKSRVFNLETVFFITPTTSLERAKKIAMISKGFIYYVSVAGITGPKSLKMSLLSGRIHSLKKITNVPICVGFGVHTSSQVQHIGAFSDGVIVGSSLVKFIGDNYSRKSFRSDLKHYIVSLKGKA